MSRRMHSDQSVFWQGIAILIIGLGLGFIAWIPEIAQALP